jgi:DNA-binding beta-propeller fold protein YncE
MGGSATTIIGFSGSGGLISTVDAGPPPPPEEEVESAYRAPVATGSYLWTANPESGSVALIDVSSAALEIETLQAGNAPTYLVAVSNPEDPEDNTALVLNVLSHDATLLRVGSEPRTFSTHQGANSLEVSPSGAWALAWTDARVVESVDPLDTFQEVTVIPLESGSEKRLSVGFRPISVTFNAAETHAFVVTEEGITDIDLSGPSVAQHFEVTDNPLEDPALRDVTITPDGAWALVRVDDSPTVGIVSLSDGSRTPLTFIYTITDLDLSEDGTLAVAVLAPPTGVEGSGYALLPIPESVTEPPERAYPIPARFGSVSMSADGSVALLYTTVYEEFGEAAERVTILFADEVAPAEQADPPYRIEDVRAPVRTVFVAPDARHAIVLQEPPPDSTRAGAFSIVPIEADIRPTLVATDARPHAVAIAPDGEHALVTVRDDQRGVFGVHLVDLPTRRQDFIELASAPLATGIVAAENKGYVAQEHPEGRITIIDFREPGGAPRTVTGFELDSRTAR